VHIILICISRASATGTCFIKEEEGAYIFWMKQVPVASAHNRYIFTFPWMAFIYRFDRIYISSKLIQVPSWWWSYGNWIYNDLCNQCLSPLTLWVRIPIRRSVLDTTLCDKFVSDLRQVGDFLRLLWFPSPIKLTATI
jgi:hypothetical protein